MTWYRRRVMVVTTEEEADTVRYFQRVFNIPITGELDQHTRATLKGVQHVFGLNMTGVIDDETAAQIDRIYPEGA